MAVSYNNSTHWAWDQATLTPPVNGNTAPGSMLVATLYWDATKTVTAVPAGFVLVGTVQASGNLRAALYVKVITADDGTDGDMAGVQLDWTQSSGGTTFGVSIVSLIAGDNPARVLTHAAAARTDGVSSATLTAPTIDFDEAACVVTSFATSVSGQPSAPAGWALRGPDNGVGTAVKGAQTATTGYAPGDWTGGSSSAEQIAFTLAVVDTVEVDPNPTVVTMPTLAFEANVNPVTVSGANEPGDGTVQLATLAFRASLGVLRPQFATATVITIDVVNVANEDQGVMTVAAQLRGGADTWVGDIAVSTNPVVWKFTTNGTHTIELIPNSSIEAIGEKPGSTWYDVTLGKQRTVPIEVPTATGLVSLHDCHDAYLDRID